MTVTSFLCPRADILVRFSLDATYVAELFKQTPVLPDGHNP